MASIADIREQIGKENLDALVSAVLDKHHLFPNKDGVREISAYWDYQDKDALNQRVADHIAEMSKEFDRPEDVKQHIMTGVYEIAHDWFWEDETRSWDEIISDIKEALDDKHDIDAEDIEHANWLDMLYDDFKVVYNDGVDEQIENCSFNVNLCVGIGEEWNYDFGSIHDMRYTFDTWNACRMDNDWEELEDATLDDEILKENGLTWLVKSQGYELQDAFVEGRDLGSSRFLSSAKEELDNFPNVMGQVAILARINLDTFCELYAKEGGNFAIDPKELPEIGIFSRWMGGGGLLGIEIERPIVISSSLVNHIQIEDHKYQYEYTVGDVFGLAAEAWNTRLTPTDEKPLLDYEVDYKALEEAFKAPFEGPGKTNVAELSDNADKALADKEPVEGPEKDREEQER